MGLARCARARLRLEEEAQLDDDSNDHEEGHDGDQEQLIGRWAAWFWIVHLGTLSS